MAVGVSVTPLLSSAVAFFPSLVVTPLLSLAVTFSPSLLCDGESGCKDRGKSRMGLEV